MIAQNTEVGPTLPPDRHLVLQETFYLGQAVSPMAPPCTFCGPGPASSPARMPAELAVLEHPSIPGPSPLAHTPIPGAAPYPTCLARGETACAVQSDTPGSQSCSAYHPTYCTSPVKWRTPQ